MRVRRAPKGYVPNARKEDQNHEDQHGTADRAVKYSTGVGPMKVRLSRLKQVSYPEIIKLTEKAAESKCKELGMVASFDVKGRMCFKCGSRLIRSRCMGKTAVRCSKKCCRMTIRRFDLAYTPFWHFQKSGRLKHKPFLNSTYVSGVKVPQDSSVHLVGAGEDAVNNAYSMIRCACAFAELYTGRTTDFGDGTLDIDATKANISKASLKHHSTHCGRFLVVYHRESKQYALEPLDDKAMLKGAPPPPETYKEVRPMVKKHFRRHGHVAASDSSQGIKKAVKESGISHVTVVHKTKNFAHVVSLPRKFLHRRLWARAAKLPTTNKKTYRMKAGGNAAEWTFSALKRNLARLNLQRSTARASVNFLFSAWVNKSPGLEGVAKGIRIYLEQIKDTCHPKDAFKSLDWLRKLED